MKICVLGAGVVGLTSAYALARRGHEVSVVDAHARVGQGASLANGAQLSYSYVAPLADASVWRNLPKYLLHRDSPLSWRPAFDAAQWRWIARFLMACNAGASARTTAELLRLAFFSRDCLAELQRELKLEFDLRSAGKLVMLASAAALEAARRQVEVQRGLGCEQQVLSSGRCVDIEPALAASRARWSGGVYTPSEQVGDCGEFCQQLAAALALQANPVRFALDTAVDGVVMAGGRVVALRSPAGDIGADAFVLANGVGSVKSAAQMGFALPIYPLKGYSVTFAADPAAGLPSVSVTDLANKIVYARLGARLRVAGRVDIVGADLSLDQRRWQALARQARRLFPALDDGDAAAGVAPWAGLRPATPGGAPIIGRTSVPNVFVNTGHGALGWTLACGSAQLLAGVVGEVGLSGVE
ncbi:MULTISPECIES: D-amino acid dehydrogenase [unclassified Janthinobacterium]|uniref:D-amino acid dehydrogenase n=1 Tax=unclassified Janthinobacterium TaxID=2610881 RepID=UPI000373A824|nr:MULTISPECIES: D-amino acid dehydrogenase [unclassified Janthinobacterium]MEC5162332.1 D-amino-acid dehydrogenase [Janthinobacterium sp. CG_S6]